MNFDFSSLNFETIDSNINAYPDMYLNQSGVTFSKKVLEDLGYPAYVLCLLDAKAKVFAIRMCKSNEPKGFKFSKPRGEQKGVVTISSKNLLEPLRAAGRERRVKGDVRAVFRVPDHAAGGGHLQLHPLQQRISAGYVP